MRKKALVLEVIAETLESINEENDIIQSYTSIIPQIELDLILENIRKLYANYRLLDKFNLEETEAIHHPAEPEPVSQHIAIGFKKKNEPEKEPLAPEQVEETLPVDITPEPELPAEPVEVKAPETPPAQPERVVDFTFDLFSGQPSTIADKYRKEEKTLNEKISSGKQQENIASKIRQTPITELKSVIGLNDKFIFINELFHGNMKAYQEAIHTLDQLTSLNDAIRYFTEVKESFDMNEELDSFRKLAEMIQRKFKG